MNDLGKALSDIAVLRAQMAQNCEFRGYGPTTLAATGVLATIAAVAQQHYLPDPGVDIRGYLMLWVSTAALSIILIGIEVVTRSRRVHCGLADEMIYLAVEQMLPAIGAAILVTAVLVHSAPTALWLLPGLWQILLSLGMFASSRSVPRLMRAGGLWYLSTGLACIAFAHGANAFSPLAMGLPFGLGQGLAAAALRFPGEVDEES
ncbi:MAG: hypothetical protein P4M00_13150 [Azospirillaceae bacterium]|nr:hypothetical protein [Azospirillaceae bacterium]